MHGLELLQARAALLRIKQANAVLRYGMPALGALGGSYLAHRAIMNSLPEEQQTRREQRPSFMWRYGMPLLGLAAGGYLGHKAYQAMPESVRGPQGSIPPAKQPSVPQPAPDPAVVRVPQNTGEMLRSGASNILGKVTSQVASGFHTLFGRKE